MTDATIALERGRPAAGASGRSASRPHRVVVLAQEQAYPFELGIPSRVFLAAGENYEVSLCTATGAPVSTNAGFSITSDHGPEILAMADTVIVAPADPYSLRRDLDPRVGEALARVRVGARIAAICTGAFVLAAAGLLDRRATTHWECVPLFRSWYPEVELNENVLFVHDEGIAPRRWLTQQRLARARELLESTDLSIDEIAVAVGYATATSLRNHLSTRLGLLPGAYRRTFQPAASS